MQPKNSKKINHLKNHHNRQKPASRRCDVPKEKSPTDITIHKEDPSVDLACWDSVLLLHLGPHLIETIYADFQDRAAAWITDTLLHLRHLRRPPAPQLVSLCVHKGVARSSRNNRYGHGGPESHPNHPSNPYLGFSICLGGSHVLVYRDTSYDGDGFSIKPLQQLFEDKRVVVVGLGIKHIANKLLNQCALRIRSTVDLRLLMANAYGKDSVWWPKHEKGRVVIDGLGLEEMAEKALEGIRLEKKPAKVLEADWSDHHYHYLFDDDEAMELIKYASRDAFVSYKIAETCIQKAGLPSNSEDAPAED